MGEEENLHLRLLTKAVTAGSYRFPGSAAIL
jgi:hypothetical protein